ncbi:MAG: HAD family hydrolase [Betaproteobacteria bacterium]|nr:MAG: HAD family hydrolase [Betaproteobacteria bacterium]
MILATDDAAFDKLNRHSSTPCFKRFYVPITTLFFDLDGTVSNNALGIQRCLNYGLAKLGYKTLSEQEVKPFIGPPFRESLPKHFYDIDVEAVLHLYRERYAEHGWQENQIYDGVTQAIRTLYAQGFTIALCTSKPRVFAERIIEHFELTRYFDGVHGPEFDGRFDKKTDLLSHLVTHYNVDPTKAVMIGDRDKDIEAALHVNTNSIGVLWGFGDRAELEAAGALRIVDSPSELVDAVHQFQ